MSDAVREAVRAMLIYTADGAKALGPLLDRPRWCRTRREYMGDILMCRTAAEATGDIGAMVVLTMLDRLHWKQCRSVWVAYHGTWEIGPDGEPREPHVADPEHHWTTLEKRLMAAGGEFVPYRTARDTCPGVGQD